MEKEKVLHILNLSVFLQTQLFLLPVLFLFYQHCGLSIGDFFLFQGIFSLAGLLFEIPMGYLGDVFSKRNILILSYSFFVIRLLLWIFFAQYGYWILLAGEILYAAQKASFSGTSDSYMYEYLNYKNSSQKMLKKYGKMNFCMSTGTAIASLLGAFLYHSVSKWTVTQYHHDYGFIVLLGLELILNTTALGLLFFLPKVPTINKKAASLTQIYSNFFNIIVQTVKNNKIRWHILYSGLLAATTVIFVWSFQPIMKTLLIPVSIYGVIYFINHMFRGLSSFLLGQIRKIISLSELSVLTFILFFICFILSFIILNVHPASVWINLGYFIFVCFVIGLQLCFLLSHVTRLHSFVPQNSRTTISSINTAVGRLYAGSFLILLKILTGNFSLAISLLVCLGLFLIAAIPLKFVYSISKSEKD